MNQYLQFWATRYSRIDRSRAVGPKSCIVPGCASDRDPRKNFKHKFDRWYDRPLAAQKLYWKTHPHPFFRDSRVDTFLKAINGSSVWNVENVAREVALALRGEEIGPV